MRAAVSVVSSILAISLSLAGPISWIALLGFAAMLRAICLGALHGPLSKSPEQRGYFSNQMPRTFASKPDYSVRFWQERGLRPVATDVMGVIERRVERLELDTLPTCRGNSRISAADARLEKGYSHMPSRIDLVITSPPYYGMRTYIADQLILPDDAVRTSRLYKCG